MQKTNINNKLFSLIENKKYIFAQKKYPAINKIFNIANFDLPFIESDCAHNHLKKMHKIYNRRFKKIETTYQDYIYELALLINKIKYNPNIEEIMYIYAYIYNNGYLSIKNNFKFTYPKTELEFRKGLSIINGNGVCRNIGSMFSDLLNCFDVENYEIITDRATYESEHNNLIKEYYNLFTRDIKSFEQELRNLDYDETERGNHYEIIIHDKNWYLLDPTCLCMYDITSNKTNYPVLNYLCLWSMYAMGEHSLKETINMYNLFEDKYLQLYKNHKTISTQKDCFKRCEKNKTKILTFHKKTQEHREIINKFLTD